MMAGMGLERQERVFDIGSALQPRPNGHQAASQGWGKRFGEGCRVTKRVIDDARGWNDDSTARRPPPIPASCAHARLPVAALTTTRARGVIGGAASAVLPSPTTVSGARPHTRRNVKNTGAQSPRPFS